LGGVVCLLVPSIPCGRDSTAFLRILLLWAGWCSCKAVQLLGGLRKQKSSLEPLAEEPHVAADALELLSGW